MIVVPNRVFVVAFLPYWARTNEFRQDENVDKTAIFPSTVSQNNLDVSVFLALMRFKDKASLLAIPRRINDSLDSSMIRYRIIRG